MAKSAARDLPLVDVIGLGQCSVDRLCRVKDYPRAGQKVAAELRQSPGGQVMTALLAVARLGARAHFVGAVGDDTDGARVRRELEAAGVAAQLETVAGGHTRSATVIVDASGERTILEHQDPRVRPGAALLQSPALVEGRALHLDVSSPEAAIAAAHRAREAGLLVSVDVDTLPAGVVEQLFPLVDLLVVSAQVPALLGAKDDEAALSLLRGHCRGLICVTLGERGAVALDQHGELHRAQAFEVEAVDTTGCGDVFRGALLVACLEGLSTGEALRFASAAAALAATALGAQGRLPTREEVGALLAKG